MGVTLALLAAVGGWAASLTVGGVDQLGSATADVVAPSGPVKVTDVAWGVNTNNVCEDAGKVSNVTVTFDIVTPETFYDSIFLAVKDGSGGVLKERTFLNESINGGIGGSQILWSFAPFPGGCVSSSLIEEFVITVVDGA